MNDQLIAAAEKVRLAQEDLLDAQRAAGKLEDERVITALEALQAALREQALVSASGGREQVPSANGTEPALGERNAGSN